MRHLALLVFLAAPLAAQSPDSAAVAAAALREVPSRDSAVRVSRLVVRGDTARVTVALAGDDRHARALKLTLVRRGGRWVALPQRTYSVGRRDRPR